MRSRGAILEEPTESTNFATNEPVDVGTFDVNDPENEEVLVEIGAASLCHTDVSIVHGHLEEQYPMVMGHEGAGIVREVGDRVETLDPGDHVALGRASCGKCNYCRVGQSHLCPKRFDCQTDGTLRNGAIKFSRDGEALHHCHSVSSFSEHTVVTEEVAVPINEDIPMEEATLLGCGVFTGVGAVTNTADVEAGASIAIFGVGGVGLCTVQGATLCSALDIIAVDPVPEKLEIAEDLGATHTIDPTERDPVDAIRDITGDGVDYAFEVAGNEDVVEQTVNVLRPTGTSVLVGIPPYGKRDLQLDLYDIVLSEKNIIGSLNGSYNLPVAIRRLSKMVATDQLSLSELVTGRKQLGNINQALMDLESGFQIRQVIEP